MPNHTGRLIETRGRPIKCRICKMGGGTLVKVGEGEYAHQDKDKCALLMMRRELTKEKLENEKEKLDMPNTTRQS